MLIMMLHFSPCT